MEKRKENFLEAGFEIVAAYALAAGWSSRS